MIRPTSSRSLRWPRQAFTLIEISVVMALMGILMLLLVASLLGVLKTDQLSSQISTRQAVQEALADQFRQDVAGASATPGEWDEWTAGPACLILRRSESNHIVYRWDEGVLQRFESGERGGLHPMPLGGEHFGVEFLRSKGDRPILTLKITEKRNGVDQAPVEIVAALGGDLR